MIATLNAAMRELYLERVPSADALRVVAALYHYELMPLEMAIREFPHEDAGFGGPVRLFLNHDGDVTAGHYDWYARRAWFCSADPYREASPFTGSELDV